MTFFARLALGASLLVSPAAGVSPSVAPPEAAIGPTAPKACTPADQCCQVCDRGKACGKSCIQATKTCHKGRGCACNLAEVCPIEP